MDFRPLGKSKFTGLQWFHIHGKLSVWHIAKLLVKVIRSSAVDPGLSPGSSPPRQKNGVGQEIANFCLQLMILKKNLIQVLNEPT